VPISASLQHSYCVEAVVNRLQRYVRFGRHGIRILDLLAHDARDNRSVIEAAPLALAVTNSLVVVVLPDPFRWDEGRKTQQLGHTLTKAWTRGQKWKK